MKNFVIPGLLALMIINGCANIVTVSPNPVPTPDPTPTPVMPTPVMPTPVRPHGHVNVSCEGPEAEELPTAANNFRVRAISLSPTGRRIWMPRLHTRLGWSGQSLGGHVVGVNGTQYFNDLRLGDLGNGEIVMGPVVELIPTRDLTESDVIFAGNRVIVEAETTRRFGIMLDTAAHKDGYHDLVFGRYSLDLNVEDPRHVFTDGELRWADGPDSIGEGVSNDDITYDQSCLAAPASHDFFVRAHFPDLLAGRGVLAPSITVNGNAGGVAMVDVLIQNEGLTAGALAEFEVEVNARAYNRTGGTTDIVFAPLTTRCDLQSVTTDRLIAHGIVSGSRVLFTRIVGADVAAVSEEHFIVRCDLVWSNVLADAMSAVTYQFRTGALHGSFHVRNDGGQERIDSTTVLNDARLWSTPSDQTTTITLRPFGIGG